MFRRALILSKLSSSEPIKQAKTIDNWVTEVIDPKNLTGLLVRAGLFVYILVEAQEQLLESIINDIVKLNNGDNIILLDELDIAREFREWKVITPKTSYTGHYEFVDSMKLLAQFPEICKRPSELQLNGLRLILNGFA